MTGDLHPDTILVDRLTAWLNSQDEPSGGDAMELLCSLIADSGRPLLSQTWEVTAEVDYGRYGIATGVVTAGDYTMQVAQPDGDHADLVVEILTDDGDDFGLAVVVNGRTVLEAMPCTWTSSVPQDLQLTPQAPPRRC